MIYILAATLGIDVNNKGIKENCQNCLGVLFCRGVHKIIMLPLDVQI